MKNKFAFLFAIILLIAVVLGCSSIKSLSSKGKTPTPTPTDQTLTDKAIDTAIGEEKTGVPECDEVSDFFTREVNNPDDGYVAKAIKAVIFNRIKEQFKKAIEDNKTDKAELAKQCKDFMIQLQKAKSEQDSKDKK